MPGARVHNEDVNSYGYWVKTSGIKIDNYSGLFLWNHNRAWQGLTTEVLPIGGINRLRVNGSELLIDDPEFDMEDEFAAKLARKYEKGYLKSFSIGIIPLTFSDRSEDLKPGQRLMTITEAELVEISLCDIPANRSAVKLYERDPEGNLVQLSDELIEGKVPALPTTTNLSQSNTTIVTEIQQVAVSLGLSEATLPAVQQEINRLKETAGKVVTLSAKLQSFEDAEKARQSAEVDTLLSQAVTDKKISEAQRPHFATLAAADLTATKAILDGMTPMVKLSEYVDTSATPGGSVLTHNGKTFSQLSRDNPNELERLKETNNTLFCQLYRSEFGKEYRPTVR